MALSHMYFQTVLRHSLKKTTKQHEYRTNSTSVNIEIMKKKLLKCLYIYI